MTEREKDRRDQPNLLHPFDVKAVIKDARNQIWDIVYDAMSGRNTADQATYYIIDLLIDEIDWITREEEKIGDAEKLEKIANILKGEHKCPVCTT